MFTLSEGALEKARRYLEKRSKETEELTERDEIRLAGPCITISRQAGAGSKEVAKILIKILEENDKKENPEWVLFDKRLIEKVVEDHNLPAYTGKFLDETRTEIHSLMHEYIAGTPGNWTLAQKTSGTILQLAESGNSVIIGRGGNVVTAKLINTFHVRLIALMDDRIKHVKDFYKIGKDEAIDFIEKDDNARKKYLLSSFHKNIDDPLIYHLVINTSLVGYRTAAELIANAVIKNYPVRMGIF